MNTITLRRKTFVGNGYVKSIDARMANAELIVPQSQMEAGPSKISKKEEYPVCSSYEEADSSKQEIINEDELLRSSDEDNGDLSSLELSALSSEETGFSQEIDCSPVLSDDCFQSILYKFNCPNEIQTEKYLKEVARLIKSKFDKVELKEVDYRSFIAKYDRLHGRYNKMCRFII